MSAGRNGQAICCMAEIDGHELVMTQERLLEILLAATSEVLKLRHRLDKIAKHPDTPQLIKQYAEGKLDG